MEESKKEKSNFEKAVDLALTEWVNSLCNEMGKNTAFLCGGTRSFYNDLDFSLIQDVVKSIIEDNEITKIYFCNRNEFDKNFLYGIPPEIAKNLELVLITDKYRRNSFKYQYPHLEINEFKHYEIKPEEYYRTIYHYALTYSKYMITGCSYDDDISVYIKEDAIKDEKTIIDFYSYFLE